MATLEQRRSRKPNERSCEQNHFVSRCEGRETYRVCDPYMTPEDSSILEDLGGSTPDPKLEDVECEENRG